MSDMYWSSGLFGRLAHRRVFSQVKKSISDGNKRFVPNVSMTGRSPVEKPIAPG
jgi:hypothetical protein